MACPDPPDLLVIVFFLYSVGLGREGEVMRMHPLLLNLQRHNDSLLGMICRLSSILEEKRIYNRRGLFCMIKYMY